MTRPTPRDVIAASLAVARGDLDTEWLADADRVVEALDHAGISTYHEADARDGYLAPDGAVYPDLRNLDHAECERVVVIPTKAE